MQQANVRNSCARVLGHAHDRQLVAACCVAFPCRKAGHNKIAGRNSPPYFPPPPPLLCVEGIANEVRVATPISGLSLCVSQLGTAVIAAAAHSAGCRFTGQWGCSCSGCNQCCCQCRSPSHPIHLMGRRDARNVKPLPPLRGRSIPLRRPSKGRLINHSKTWTILTVHVGRRERGGASTTRT